MTQSVTVIGMIYRSLDYLSLMSMNMRLRCPGAELLIVCNDAAPKVLDAARATEIPVLDYRDPKPDDYYLNRVYRAWNAGARAAQTDVIVFLNSDMWGSHGWIENLLKHLTKDTIPCSRLVESGKMPSGQHAVVKDFGTAKTFNAEKFERFASSITEDRVEDGGLFMPCAFWTKDFLDAGGYPAGNIYRGGVGAHGTKFIRSGDDHFFHHTMSSKRHITVMDSLVWHEQVGEMDS